MNKTHYELVCEEKAFRVDEVITLLKKRLPTGNFTWDEFGLAVYQEGLSDLKITEQGILAPSQEEMTSLQMLFHIYSYTVGAGRTYEVLPDIGEMLLNTKLDVDVQMVKSPFREIQIVVPDLLEIYNEQTGMHKIHTLYCNLNERSDTDKTLRVLCVGRPNKLSFNIFDDALFFFRIHLKEGKVSESLRENEERWKQDPYHKMYSTINDQQIMPRVFQFVLNILLYITSSNNDIRLQNTERKAMEQRLAGLKSTAKIRKLQNRIDKESSINRYVIGSSIQLSKEERDLYDAIRHSGKHMIRYPVGGHWRNQPRGNREAPTYKLTWIRPHFRGPELAELIQSIGVLK